MNWFPFTYVLDNLITNSIHAWLTKNYRSSGMRGQRVPGWYDHVAEYHQEALYADRCIPKVNADHGRGGGAKHSWIV